MMIVAIGAFVGIVIAVFMVLARISTERGTWATLLVAIAIFYPVFAVESGSLESFAVQIGAASFFIILAFLGARVSLWFVAAGLPLHGLFDWTADYMLADPSPDWWGPFCVGVDFVAAAYLAIKLWRKQL